MSAPDRAKNIIEELDDFHFAHTTLIHSFFILGKKTNRKTDKKCRKLLHKKPKLQTCLKGGKIDGRAPKNPPN